ncbi:MAG: hypothetical protein ABR587_08505 [Candidatus Binatia bacterium]
MVRSSRILSALIACSVLAVISANTAAAHCCHDDRRLGSANQSEFRRGLHGMEGGLTDEPIQRNPPAGGGGLDRTGSLNEGGHGQMRGGSLGNYGAGSLGERGPGGLGTLQGNSIHTQPPRPR